MGFADGFDLIPGVHLFAKIFVFLLLLQFSHDSAEVQFEKQILPIFKQHCFECHGDGETEGELSLESISSIRRGGHTGSPLLATKLTDSELYLRIVSLSEGYRMPKRNDPLSKQDVETISAWISSVPEVDATESSATATSTASVDSAETNRSENSSDSSQYPALIIASVLILALVGWLVIRSFSDRNRGRRFSQNHNRSAAFIAMFVGAMNLLLLCGAGYLYFEAEKLKDENASLKAELRSLQPKMPPPIRVDDRNLPLPPHPMHPPRLGGLYYRGNDERDDSLFNGGFYRTATIDLHLINSAGVRLDRNDKLSDDLSIEIEIQRAPKATKELFNQRVLKMVSLEHFCQTAPRFNQSSTFTAVKKDDLWKATIPLPKQSKWGGGRLRGMVYMMYGVQPSQQLPRPHFAIRYDIQTDGDKISNESVLWMGSMYTLGGRVLVPEEGKILLDRWFDWRPIPVIEGEAATDPKLLGVEEHSGQ